MLKPVVVDIELPDDARPVIAYPRGSFPTDPIFAVVIPPGGCEEDARIFAICVTPQQSKPAVRKVRRPSQQKPQWYAVEALDPETVPRLFERGIHPGDFRILGTSLDRTGERTAPLVFFDFSLGPASKMRSSTSPELRLALAQACESVGTKAWKGAAEVADPSGLLRQGVVSLPETSTQTELTPSFEAAKQPIRDYRLLSNIELLDEIGRDARSILYGCPDLPANGPSAVFLKKDIDAFLSACRGRNQDTEAAYTVLADQMGKLLKSGKDKDALARLSAGYGPGAVPWRNLFAESGLIATLMDRTRHPNRKHPATEQVAALPEWAKAAFISPAEILLRRPSSLEEAEYALDTLKYTYFPLKPNRLAAAPGLRRILNNLDDARLNQLVDNNEALIKAFDEIENSCQLRDEARDAVAIGWHVVAHSFVSRFPEEAESVHQRAPSFVTEDARSRPFLVLSQSAAPSATPSHRP
ncbi:hypothetical protein ACVIGB_000428 [Bradyrhizobium sp. USDA 4341]